MRKLFVAAVGNYPDPIADRPSAINDMVDLQATLQSKRGFTSFASLTDGAATRSAILAQWQAALSGSVSGDAIMLAFFGHGTPGSGICPYDTDPVTGANVIWDYELGAILAQKPMGVTVDVLLGCCYGSNGTRESRDESFQNAKENFKEKSPKVIGATKVAPLIFPSGKVKTSVPVPGMNHCLFAASSGIAYDCTSGGKIRGLHTVWWCYVIRNALTWTRSQIDAYTTTKVKLTAPTQDPLVEGTTAELAQIPFT